MAPSRLQARVKHPFSLFGLIKLYSREKKGREVKTVCLLMHTGSVTTPCTGVSPVLSSAHSPSPERLSGSCLKVKRTEGQLETQRFRVMVPGNHTRGPKESVREYANHTEGSYRGSLLSVRAEGELEAERPFPRPEHGVRHAAITGPIPQGFSVVSINSLNVPEFQASDMQAMSPTQKETLLPQMVSVSSSDQE